ncbi:MAG: hypothetical protein IJW40_01745 [Clostridia bacterium]|nr:hypothetical protein [Clostridia bacterium]
MQNQTKESSATLTREQMREARREARRQRWLAFCERNAPPGMDLRQELGFFAMLAICAVGYHALIWWIRYLSALSDLYGWDELRGSVLLSDAHMFSYVELLGKGDILGGYVVAMLCVLALSALHYGYFWRGGRSIYVMWRLPRRGELWRRVFALPLCGALLCLAAMVVHLLINFILYMLLTPAGVGAVLV